MLLGLKSQTCNFRAEGESLLPSSCKGSPRASPHPLHVPACGRDSSPPLCLPGLGLTLIKVFSVRGDHLPSIVDDRQMLLSLLDVPCRQKLGMEVVAVTVMLRSELSIVGPIGRRLCFMQGPELVKGLVWKETVTWVGGGEGVPGSCGESGKVAHRGKGHHGQAG